MGLSQEKAASPVLGAMKTELLRSMEKLKSQPVPPYFISYEVSEHRSSAVAASFGQITYSGDSHARFLDVDLRVGGYDVDNTREIRGQRDLGRGMNVVEVPIEDDADAIRSVLWYQTDIRYKRAQEQLTKVKTNMKVKVEQEDKSGDFSREQPSRFTQPIQTLSFDRKIWEEKLRKYTAPFAKYDKIYVAQASVNATVETRWFVNSEGSQIQTSHASFRLGISAQTKAEDGMVLPRAESYFSATLKGLPDDVTVLKAVEKMIGELEALRTAPVADPYSGPAILSGRASGVLFHETFGHRAEGHRLKNEAEGQTFKKMVGQKLFAEGFSVVFDPTQTRLGNTDLSGFYEYDDEGVKAQRVGVVENGVLKTFLMSRDPVEGFPNSNGHGRHQTGRPPVARQSNLIVEASPAVTRPDLKKLLIDEITKQGKPYGLYFEDISGGFTMTGRTLPNAFNVLPLLVYRIYSDGREELVRGVDLIGTPLTTFGKITAADAKLGVFNGVCGAESGAVPVSAVSPGIFISQVETQKKDKSQDRPPILPAPTEEGK